MPQISPSATALSAASQALEAIGSNLANAASSGYKRQTPQTVSLVYQDMVSGGGPVGQTALDIPKVQVGTGVRMGAILRSLHKGMPKATQNPFDVYINGAGYLRVDLGNGQFAYTQSGALKIDENGLLQTVTGYPLSDNIIIDMTRYDQVLINKSGVVLGVDPSQTGQARYQELGRITLWNFKNPQGLEQMEDTLLLESPESGPSMQGSPGISGMGTLMQGHVEQSNVKPASELMEAIRISEWSKANATMIHIESETEKATLRQISEGS